MIFYFDGNINRHIALDSININPLDHYVFTKGKKWQYIGASSSIAGFLKINVLLCKISNLIELNLKSD